MSATDAGRRARPRSSSPQRSPPAAVLSARRAARAVVAGVAAGALVTFAGEPALAPVVGWLVAAALVLFWVWRELWPMGSAETKRAAELESETRTTDTAVLAAAVGSLGLAVLALVRSTQQDGAAAPATVVLCTVAIIASWAVVNTVFALKYAREYYFDEDGGIDFKQADPPAYSDFAYMAFSVGMAFQVPDSEPTASGVRRLVLGHALLSYVFGTGIVAVTINLVANLGQL